MNEENARFIKLSEQCWQSLNKIQQVGYATGFFTLISGYLNIVQNAIVKNSVGKQVTWYRLESGGRKIDFCVDDEALINYKPIIQEYSCFGSAVKILSAYENYISNIVDLTETIIPENLNGFKKLHKVKDRKTFWSDKLGRGIDFLSEIFNWKPQGTYRPMLRFMFHLRNLAVHNSNMVDKKLIALASNEHIKIGGCLWIGKYEPWDFNRFLDLNHLVISILENSDPLVSSKLHLNTIDAPAFWDI